MSRSCLTSSASLVTYVSELPQFGTKRGNQIERVLPRMSARAFARVLTLLASFVLIVHVIPAGAVEPEMGRVAGDLGGRWGFNKQERCIMNKINRVRRNKGLRALRADKQVGVVARRHAKSMAANCVRCLSALSRSPSSRRRRVRNCATDARIDGGLRRGSPRPRRRAGPPSAAATSRRSA